MFERVQSALKNEIRQVLVPEFHNRGFVSVPLTFEEQRTEVGFSFPFGRLRRADR